MNYYPKNYKKKNIDLNKSHENNNLLNNNKESKIIKSNDSNKVIDSSNINNINDSNKIIDLCLNDSNKIIDIIFNDSENINIDDSNKIIDLSLNNSENIDNSNIIINLSLNDSDNSNKIIDLSLNDSENINIDNSSLNNSDIDKNENIENILSTDISYISDIEKNNEWSLIDIESSIKWNFIDELNYKEKIKFNLINKYNKIGLLILYSLKLVINSKTNNYINLIYNTTNIIDTINTNNSLINISSYSINTIKNTINEINYRIMPFIENFKLQYNYNRAFKFAYFNMINITYNLILPFLIEINKNLYNDCEREFYIDNLNTEFIIIFNNYKYIFVYHQFLLNLGFQLDLQNYLNNIINNLIISFRISNNSDKEFIIKIKYLYN